MMAKSIFDDRCYLVEFILASILTFGLLPLCYYIIEKHSKEDEKIWQEKQKKKRNGMEQRPDY